MLEEGRIERTLPFDEVELIGAHIDYLKRQTGFNELSVSVAEEKIAENMIASIALPGQPSYRFYLV